MPELYFTLAAVHIVAVVVTGIMWAIIDIVKGSSLRAHLRDIQAVHFGSLYLVPWFFGLAYALERLHVPPLHWIPFPAGLGALVFFSGVAYLFPKPPDIDPFYYWTRGLAMGVTLIGIACLIVALLWTATALTWYAVAV